MSRSHIVKQDLKSFFIPSINFCLLEYCRLDSTFVPTPLFLYAFAFVLAFEN